MNANKTYVFSVIVPVYNEQENINDCLSHIRSLDTDNSCQIIVVDGDEKASTITAIKADDVAKIVSERSRATQMNAGARIAGAEIFTRAFAALGKHQAVVSPAADGGYCLIGFMAKGFLPDIFDNIDWSTEKVFNQTMQIFQHHKTNYYGLTRWFDIDTIDDLEDMLIRNTNTDFRKTASFKYATKTFERVADV